MALLDSRKINGRTESYCRTRRLSERHNFQRNVASVIYDGYVYSCRSK